VARQPLRPVEIRLTRREAEAIIASDETGIYQRATNSTWTFRPPLALQSATLKLREAAIRALREAEE
jgi:hypothetical protein